MNDDIGAMLKGPEEIRCAKCIIYDREVLLHIASSAMASISGISAFSFLKFQDRQPWYHPGSLPLLPQDYGHPQKLW